MEKETCLLDNFRQPMVSLVRLCTVQVNTEIITAGCVDNHAAIDSLEIPLHLKTPMKALMESMVTSFHWHWRQGVHLEGGPIFSPDGNLDMRRCTRVFVEDESLDVGTRFLVATTYCHEDYVSKLGPTLTNDQLDFFRGYNDKHSDIHILVWKHGMTCQLWLDIIEALGAAEGPDQRVLDELYAQGLCYAWDLENYAAASYFSCKMSTRILVDVMRVVQHRYLLIQSKPYDGVFTPQKFRTVLLKMDEVEKEQFRSDSHRLLELLPVSREEYMQWVNMGYVPTDPFHLMLCLLFLQRVLFHVIDMELTDEEHLVRTLLRLQTNKIENPLFRALRLLHARFDDQSPGDEVYED